MSGAAVTRIRAVALGCALALAAVAPARADSPKLGDARRAIEAVRYDDAQRLLVEAVSDGGNSPAALRQIYELSGATATVLGRRELAEQYYRRWLALDPAAALGDDVAPKLREPFIAAQAYMAAHGRLAVVAERRSATAVEIIVESDPLAMAVAVAVEGGERVALGAGRRATLAVAADRAGVRALVLDEHANHLVELAVGPPAPGAAAPTSSPAIVEPPRVRPPFLRRWTTWAAPSAACIVAGGVLGMIALTRRAELVEAIDRSGEHFFDDVAADQRTIRRTATVGIAVGAAGALLAIPAAVFYIRSRRPNDLSPSPLRISPLAHPGGGGIAVGGAF